MNSNWFKLVMKMTKVKYGKKLLLKGMPVIFNKKGASLVIGDNCCIKSSFLSNLVGLYSKTIIVTRFPERQFMQEKASALVTIRLSEETVKYWTMTFILSNMKTATD